MGILQQKKNKDIECHIWLLLALHDCLMICSETAHYVPYKVIENKTQQSYLCHVILDVFDRLRFTCNILMYVQSVLK